MVRYEVAIFYGPLATHTRHSYKQTTVLLAFVFYECMRVLSGSTSWHRHCDFMHTIVCSQFTIHPDYTFDRSTNLQRNAFGDLLAYRQR